MVNDVLKSHELFKLKSRLRESLRDLPGTLQGHVTRQVPLRPLRSLVHNPHIILLKQAAK
jgi:hypothetical protein